MKTKTTRFDVEKKQADWLVEILKLTSPQNSGSMTYKNLKEMYDEQNNRSYSFEKYWESESLKKLRAAGLLVL